MHLSLKFASLAAVFAVAVPVALRAQDTCSDKIAVDSVFQTANTGNNKSTAPFVYSVKVRNKTSGAAKFTLVFGTFSREVKLYYPTITDSLGGGASKDVKFAHGTSQNVNSGSVPVVFKQPFGAKPFVYVTDCSVVGQ